MVAHSPRRALKPRLHTEDTMMEDEQERRRSRPMWLWLSLAAVVALLAVLIVPPLVSISRFKAQITNLVSRSLGRPARLSSVTARLLPRPGFVLYDLVVDDSPAFGAEPVIHASSVTAPIRIASLWRGRLEISEISVDEASLNLVRTPDGLWNLDSLLASTTTNASKAQAEEHRAQFPRLVATNSRINFKSGVEKLPYSLINADLSFWQSNPGEWRLQLRAQPARTDVSIESGDTGIVEIDATAKQVADLRKMPIHLDLNWRQAQLGQLTRLATGSDAGWRGDLRGEVHVDGTPEDAKITTRLRATGVHRAEFAPPEPMDFDANCSLEYRYTKRTVDGLECFSPIGGGRIHVTGEMAGNGHVPKYSVEMDRVPVSAGLEALRTVRSGVDPNVNAAGTISGKVVYDDTQTPDTSKTKSDSLVARAKARFANGSSSSNGPFTGSFTVDGFQLSGGELSRPVTGPKMTIAPTSIAQGRDQALAGTIAIPLGGAVPLTIDLRFAFRSYELSARGQVSIPRAREIAHATGLPHAEALDQLAGEPLAVDLRAQGPWLPTHDAFGNEIQPAIAAVGIVSGIATSSGTPDSVVPTADNLSGTVTFRNANWKADYLANHVEISDATLHVVSGELHWDPINFIYGPLKGSATVTIPQACSELQPCPVPLAPSVDLRFASLDSATVQTAILGAQEKGTVLSDLLKRLRPAAAPVWPQLQCSATADTVVIGPVTMQSARAQFKVTPTGIEIAALDGKLLGGTVHATGTLVSGDKPDYAISADLQNLNPTAVGQFLGQNWRGGTLYANGKVELAGYTGSDLADSAKGTLHFEWRNGSATGIGLPAELARFDRWTADAEIANGRVTFGQNEVMQNGRKHSVAASVTLANPAKLSFGSPEEQTAAANTESEKKARPYHR